MADKPLFIQSDRTILLDVHSAAAEAARSAIIPFAELIKSPEHIHTYAISQISIWNAASVGISYDGIVKSLEEYSRFDIPASVLWFIKDSLDRYGGVKLTPFD